MLKIFLKKNINKIGAIMFVLVAFFCIPIDGKSNRVEAATTIKNYATSTGLIAYWSFNEGTSTTAKDFSGNPSQNMAFNGAPVWSSGRVLRGINFDGSSYLRMNLTSLLSSTLTASMGCGATSTAFGHFTISAWVKPDTLSQNTSILGEGYGNDLVFGMGDGTTFPLGRLFLNMDDSRGSSPYSNRSLQAGVWQHVAVTYDKDQTNQVTFYINGVAAGTGVNIDTDFCGGNGNLSIGYQSRNDTGQGFPNDMFKGGIDEVRVYNQILSASDINNLYKAGAQKINASQNTKVVNGLVGLWSFDNKDIRNATTTDRSGNGFDLKMNKVSPVTGRIGQAFRFSDSGSRLSSSVFSTPNTNSLSISTWFNLTSTTSTAIITDGGGDLNFRLQIVNGRLNGKIGNGVSWLGVVSGSTDLKLNQWYHVVQIYDISNNTDKLYLNGVLDGSSSATLTRNSASGISIGNYSMSDAYAFSGSIDEFRVYNKAISTTEINQLYSAGKVTSKTYDVDAEAYFTASGLANPTGRSQVDEFIKGLKKIGVWNNITEAWTLRDYQNSSSGTLYGLKHTYTGTRTGTTTITKDGLIMGDSTSGVNYSPNINIPFSTGGFNAFSIWGGLSNPITTSDSMSFLKSSGGELSFYITTGVGGGTSWLEQMRDVFGSRNYNFGNSASVTGNHMVGWNADTKYIFRDGVGVLAGVVPTTARADGVYQLQTRGRGTAVPSRVSFVLFTQPGINLTNTQMTQMYVLYKNTIGKGLVFP